MLPENRIDTAAEGCGKALELAVLSGARKVDAVREEGRSCVVDVDHPAVNVLGVAGSELPGRGIVGVVAGNLDRNPAVVFGMDFQRRLADAGEGMVVPVFLQVADPEILVGMGLVDCQAAANFGMRGVGICLEMEADDDEDPDGGVADCLFGGEVDEAGRYGRIVSRDGDGGLAVWSMAGVGDAGRGSAIARIGFDAGDRDAGVAVPDASGLQTGEEALVQDAVGGKRGVRLVRMQNSVGRVAFRP